MLNCTPGLEMVLKDTQTASTPSKMAKLSRDGALTHLFSCFPCEAGHSHIGAMLKLLRACHSLNRPSFYHRPQEQPGRTVTILLLKWETPPPLSIMMSGTITTDHPALLMPQTMELKRNAHSCIWLSCVFHGQPRRGKDRSEGSRTSIHVSGT